MTWEHLYVTLAAVAETEQSVHNRVHLQVAKETESAHFFKGYQHNTQAPVLWNSKLAALAAGFSDPPALP